MNENEDARSPKVRIIAVEDPATTHNDTLIASLRQELAEKNAHIHYLEGSLKTEQQRVEEQEAILTRVGVELELQKTQSGDERHRMEVQIAQLGKDKQLQASLMSDYEKIIDALEEKLQGTQKEIEALKEKNLIVIGQDCGALLDSKSVEKLLLDLSESAKEVINSFISDLRLRNSAEAQTRVDKEKNLKVVVQEEIKKFTNAVLAAME